MLRSFLRSRLVLVALTAATLTSHEALAAPALADPGSATLELVTPSAAEQAKLDQVDGLAFDAFGNLLAPLEIFTNGAIVYIDKDTGIVTTLLTNIDHPDQIALDASGDMWFALEVTPASTSNRIRTFESLDLCPRRTLSATSRPVPSTAT